MLYIIMIAQAALDFSLACQVEHILEKFEEEFLKWAQAIFATARTRRFDHLPCNSKPLITPLLFIMVCSYLCSSSDHVLVSFLPLTAEQSGMMAMRCLALLFSPLKTKKLGENIPFIMKVVTVSNHSIL